MNPDFIKTYLKSTLEKGFKTGGRSVVQDIADGLSDEHLNKLIELLLETRRKRAEANKIEIKQIK
jgi:cytochrome c553